MAIFHKKTGEGIDIKYNLSLYFNLAKKYKRLFFVIILVALVVEGSLIFEKFLFKVVIDDGTRFFSGELTRDLLLSGLVLVGIAFLITVSSRSIGHWLQIWLTNRLNGKMILDIKKKFFNHLVHLDHNFHTSHKTGSLISRMNRGSRAAEVLSDFFIHNIFPLILQVVIVGASLIFFDPFSAMIVAIVSVSFVLFGFFMAYKQQNPQFEVNRADDIEKANIADVFTNIDSVKYFAKENMVKNRFAKLAEDVRVKSVRFWDYQKWFTAGQSFILGLGAFFIIYFPLLRFLDGAITLGTLTFIYTVYYSLMGPLFGFVQGIRRFYISLGDFDSLFLYDKIKNEIVDKQNAKLLRISRGNIQFKNVKFRYPSGKRAVDGVNLHIKPNEKIALVGHSGCGKTTLVKLLYRLFNLNSGEILIDGKDIKNVKQESLRRNMSIVSQEAILFDASIYDNIAFSNPFATKDQILRAIKFAQLDKVIKGLPEGRNTIVGERGVKLSGGERQRVSIARAILANRKILILDEATSALDSETEHEIQRDLDKLMQDRTSIIIAHRLSTIMKADRIVVMKKGKIVQIGKHEDLIQEEGLYRKLWNFQKGGYIGE